MTMTRTLLVLGSITLAACTLQVADLNNFTDDFDACDPRGTPHLGEDLDIHFVGTIAHVNQDMRFAVEVGTDHSAEAMFVLSTFDDQNLALHVPEILPAEPATLAFWADSNMDGVFSALNNGMECGAIRLQVTCMADPHCTWDAAGTQCNPLPPDHQWLRPICPNGQMTFTHTTPFQDVSIVSATGAVFAFHIPAAIQRHEVFDNYRVAAWAVRTNSLGRQTRAYYRWAPHVMLGSIAPTPRTPPMTFQVGRNVAGEMRGPIDQGEMYEVHFVIDSNGNHQFEPAVDYSCVWPQQPAPSSAFVWDYMPDLSICDMHGFDPTTNTH
jgi:hypothetical protein